MKLSGIVLAALIAVAASKSVAVFPATTGGAADVDLKQACVVTPFNGHTCPSSCSGMQDISAAAITTAAQCVAACCADPKVPICTYAGFNAGAKNRCIAGDWTKCTSCRHGGDTTFLVNFGPTPPGPAPPSPSPPPPPPSPSPGGGTTSTFTFATSEQAKLDGCQIYDSSQPVYVRSGSTNQDTSAT